MKRIKRLDGLSLRIYDFSSEYEVKDFQKHLNIEAHDYLKRQGIESTIMSAPQGAGASVGEGVALSIKLLLLFTKIFPFIRRYILAIHEGRVDEATRHFTIWLDANKGEEPRKTNHLSKRILIVGYHLKLYMEKMYPNYIFKIQITVSHHTNESALQLYVNKLRPDKSDIGRILQAIDKRVTGKHNVEYVTLSNNSRVRYTYYDR